VSRRYLVRWGHMHRQESVVETFPIALALFVLHYQEEGGAVVTGEGYDCDADDDGSFEVSDGLTSDEREAIEEVTREERVA